MEDTTKLSEQQREEIRQIIDLAIVGFKTSVQKELGLLTRLLSNPNVCANLRLPSDPKPKDKTLSAQKSGKKMETEAEIVEEKARPKTARNIKEEDKKKTVPRAKKGPLPKGSRTQQKMKAASFMESENNNLEDGRQSSKKKPGEVKKTQKKPAKKEVKKEAAEELTEEQKQKEKEEAMAIAKGLRPTRIPSPKKSLVKENGDSSSFSKKLETSKEAASAQ